MLVYEKDGKIIEEAAKGRHVKVVEGKTTVTYLSSKKVPEF